VFSKSSNPLDLPQKSTIRALSKAKSVDPKTYSPPSYHDYEFQLSNDSHQNAVFAKDKSHLHDHSPNITRNIPFWKIYPPQSRQHQAILPKQRWSQKCSNSLENNSERKENRQQLLFCVKPFMLSGVTKNSISSCLINFFSKRSARQIRKTVN